MPSALLELDNDELSFAAEDELMAEAAPNPGWKLLVVDDDPDVRRITRLALLDFEFAGRPLHILEADSAAAGRALLAQHPDIAVAMIDVIMETEHAGLDLVRHIRHQLGNQLTRIILRTGQPGQAPERLVIRDYDINDYKEKTELTSDKLYSAIYSSLRAYRDIAALDANRKGLEQVIHNCAEVYRIRALRHFAQGTLNQLTALLFLEPDALYLNNAESISSRDALQVVAATGCFRHLQGKPFLEDLAPDICTRILTALQSQTSSTAPKDYVGYYRTESGQEAIIYLRGKHALSPDDAQLIELFCRNISIAHENLLLKEDVEATQRELVLLLSEAVETRSPETGYHVRRVAEYAYELAIRLNIPEEEANLLHQAMPMHDLGKLGVPDAILHKRAKLSPEEWEIMREHPQMGYNLLRRSERKVLRVAALVANQHHEKWDGSGYPNGLKGEEIHLLGRIAALADVFDALGSYRSYKDPWPQAQIIEFITQGRGSHFDPQVVDCFLANLDVMFAIRDRYKDLEPPPAHS